MFIECYDLCSEITFEMVISIVFILSAVIVDNGNMLKVIDSFWNIK